MRISDWSSDVCSSDLAWWALDTLRAAAGQPDAAADTIAHWVRLSTPDAAAIARELIAHRGDFVDIEAARIANALAIQRMLPQLLVESLGMAALGIGLYHTNYFTRWPARVNRALSVAGGEVGRAHVCTPV